MGGIPVSIVIPAYNASPTIGETLQCLVAQTRQAWEAILVDDGSADATAEIARGFAARGYPVRVIVQDRLGVCAARNAGIALARGEWMLFLDADDWIVPDYLERMLAVLEADPGLDAVHCGWCRIAPDGTRLPEKYSDASPDLFPTLSRRCPFAIHACVMRKASIEAVGGFDTSLKVCEDWDLWQRAARRGARFGSVHEVLALYRMRPGSLSRDPIQFCRDGLRVLEQGHAPDPRVRDPLPVHAQGQPIGELAFYRIMLITWLAGLLLGEGKDATPMLEGIPVAAIPGVSASLIADNLFESAGLQDCRIESAWVERWPLMHGVVADFLAAVERRTRTPGLAQCVRVLLERRVVERAVALFPTSIGSTYGIRVDITRPLADVQVGRSNERLYCRVEIAGEVLGVVELPICDGVIDSCVLADAIAACFAWDMLGRFFDATIYRRPLPRGGRMRRLFGAGRLRQPAIAPSVPLVHDQIGWQVFLQQLWRRWDWPQERFYDINAVEPAPVERRADRAHIEVELGAPLPNVRVDGPELSVTLRVGGVPAARFVVPAAQGWVSAAALRVALLSETGFELCVAAVREALIGHSWSDKMPLAERLAAAARRDAELKRPPAYGQGGTAAPCPPDGSLILGRRPGPAASSASRFARLPGAVAGPLLDMASAAGEWIACRPSGAGVPHSVIYAPTLIRAGDASREFRSVAAVAAHAHPQGGQPGPNESPAGVTTALPVLMYHRVAPGGEDGMRRYRVDPAAFEQQLEYLRASGYYSVGLDEWQKAVGGRSPLPGRAIAITFDDGYQDFCDHAAPLLRRYGFSATVFLVADRIGDSNVWDQAFSEKLPLMGWAEILELQAQGFQFGSHSASHRALTGLSLAEAAIEGARSRAALETKLKVPVRAIAYPYGDFDPIVAHIMGACGYLYGLSCRPGRARLEDSLLAVPRIEIEGGRSLRDFVDRLAG